MGTDCPVVGPVMPDPLQQQMPTGMPQQGMPVVKASIRAQAGALFRKSFVYQKRNLASNICLIAAPVLFCVLLVCLQMGINQLMSGEEFQCGCQCTKCCYQGDKDNCTSFGNGTCPYTCLARNKSNCGVQYSVGAQAAFCDIPHPSAWPAIIQTPRDAERAEPYKPKVAMLYAPGSNSTLSHELAAGLLPQPQLQASNILTAQEYLTNFSNGMAQHTYVLPGEALALLGLSRLGSSSRISQAAGINIEPALVGASRTLYMLWPDGTCGQLGLQHATNTTLSTVLQAMVNASNTPAVASLINQRLGLQNLTGPMHSGTSTSESSQMIEQVAALTVNCTDVVVAKVESEAALQSQLYCANRAACCDGSCATNSYAAAFDWGNTSQASFSPVLYYNDSYGVPDDGLESSTTYLRTPQIFNMAVNSWLKAVLGNSTAAELIGIGGLPKRASVVTVDWTSTIAPVLATWVMQLPLPVYVMQLVYEKENRLRMMMKMHGLDDGPYWVVHYCWFLLLYVLYMVAFVVFGTITRISMFTANNWGIQLVFYFLWGNTMIALAFFMSCFFKSARTSAIFSYLLVFAHGLIGYMMLRCLLDLGTYAWWAEFIEIMPGLALYRGLYELASYAKRGTMRLSHGMTVSDLYDADNGMTHTWIIMAGEWAIFLVLAWYLEQVYASGTGNRRHPLYFLSWLSGRKKQEHSEAPATNSADILQLPTVDPSSRSKAGSKGLIAIFGKSSPVRMMPLRTLKFAAARIRSNSNTSDLDTHSVSNVSEASSVNGVDLEPADVAAERERVTGLTDYDAHPIVIRALNKVYPARDGQPPKLAVRRLDLAIHKGECFGLLGPNGAGKSTSISMLVGLIEATNGTAIVGGHDITKGMGSVYSIMGMCPQHDLLWETLTGREHLHFYGRLKGLEGGELDASIESCLKSVKLWDKADKPSGSYSGGMQRRLSVAISLMGNPKVVYLDEPSTGLDPASRRTLWEVVKTAKAGRSIILTTHSMEEAEVLCDRLGIFVNGRLACIGPPKDITSRFCGFLLLTVAVPAEREAEARAMVKSMAPGAVLTYSVGGTIKYELPKAEVSISRVFATMAGTQAAQLGVIDWAVANATLEEVFIRFAQQMNLKAGR